MAGSARAARKLARASARQTAAQASAKRAVGYVRVSTEEQTKGTSLDNQAEFIAAFAKSQGFDLVRVVEDRGVSGAIAPAQRPGFGEVLQLLAAGDIQVVLVWKFDRLSRNIRDAINTVHEELNARDVELRSVTEAAIDTGNSMGRIIFSILAGMAEGEREAITLRTKTGRLAKGKKGGIACGYAPLGYRRRQDGTLEVVEDEARTVRLVFDLKADLGTLQAVADRLNAMGLRGRRGGRWHPGSVAYVIENQKYRGALEYVFSQGEDLVHVHVPGAVEAIV